MRPCKKNFFKTPSIIYLFIITCVFLTANRATSLEQQKFFHQQVENQKITDKRNRERILREIRGFMDETNKKLNNRDALDLPVDEEKITDAEKQKHRHSHEQIPTETIAYVTRQDVNMRSEPSLSSDIIGRLNHNEMVTIILRSETTQKINGNISRWYLLRKSNQKEGWVFGYYLSDRKSQNRFSSGSSTVEFLVPTSGTISSKFGYRINPVTGQRHCFHSGIDIAAPMGTPVRAACDGKVMRSYFNKSGYGNLIIIQHNKELATYYGHLSKRKAAGGTYVKKGEIIGTIGATGRATGPHLHFEIRRGGHALDPESLLP